MFNSPIIKLSVIGIVFVIVLALIFKAATIVKAGYAVVVTRYGAIRDTTLNPGFHVINPLIDYAYYFDIKEQKEEVDADSASKDLQSVNTRIALNYHLDNKNVNKLYQEVGKEYKYRIIDPAIQESVKAAAAQFTAEELITKRPEVKNEIKKVLSERLGNRYIIVDDVSIVNFVFSEEFNKAIEAKQTAEQQALKAVNDLNRVKLEAQQKIEQAKAEAEALRLQRENINADLVQLRGIEAQIKAIDKWNGTLPQYTGGVIPFINVNPQK